MTESPSTAAAVPTPRATRPVEAWPCQSVCVWRPTGEVWLLDRAAEPVTAEQPDLRVFACTACGSEWVRTEPWTPVDARGVVPLEVQQERRRGR